jgi:hypothetical protein
MPRNGSFLPSRCTGAGGRSAVAESRRDPIVAAGKAADDPVDHAAAVAVAALVVAVAGTAALVGRGGGRSAPGGQALRQATPSSAPGVAGQGAAAPAAPEVSRAGPGDIDSAVLGGNLGEVGDAAALVAKVEPTLRAAGLLGTATSPPASTAPPPQGASRVVGTRPCEIEARGLEQGLGAVVYVATATHDGAPVAVLGFSRRDGSSRVSLYALTRDGCRPLFATRL